MEKEIKNKIRDKNKKIYQKKQQKSQINNIKNKREIQK